VEKGQQNTQCPFIGRDCAKIRMAENMKATKRMERSAVETCMGSDLTVNPALQLIGLLGGRLGGRAYHASISHRIESHRWSLDDPHHLHRLPARAWMAHVLSLRDRFWTTSTMATKGARSIVCISCRFISRLTKMTVFVYLGLALFCVELQLSSGHATNIFWPTRGRLPVFPGGESFTGVRTNL
jgi:hypothetical protein